MSTDFDASSRLYFEPLDAESVLDVLDNESAIASRAAPGGDLSPARTSEARCATPVLYQFGGQTAVNLAEPLVAAGAELLGGAHSVDLAEDRRLFEDLVSRLDVLQPPGAAIRTVEQALRTAAVIGYPVLVRPSFVLGGWAMEIVHNDEDLASYVRSAADVAARGPILVDKYLAGREVEVDAVSDGETVLIPGIMEHVERAGVHSGDSIAVYPPRDLTRDQADQIVEYTRRLGVGLGVRGLFNVQYVLFEGRVYVLEANPRSSRTVPFISKVTGVPMVDLATRVLLGESLAEQGYGDGLRPWSGLVAVKAPVFSMSKLPRVDTYLGPEMKSTGEGMGVDWDYDLSLAKALLAAGTMIPPAAPVLLSIADADKAAAVPLIAMLAAADHALLATEGTGRMIEEMGLPVRQITKRLSEGHPNVVDAIEGGWVGAVINTITGRRGLLKEGFQIRRAAVERRIPCFTSLDTARVAVEVVTRRGTELVARPLAQYLAGRPIADVEPVLLADRDRD